MDVVSTMPLPVLGVTLDQLPAPVQTATAADIANTGALDLADFANRRLGGVYVNEMQANPFQPDVNYRGYTASPLLGTPEGLSVYMDGVRLNQPFGDVVSWDLIPRIALGSMSLMPGSNPLFGLNTLGGALSIQTKDGRTSPGTDVQALYGTATRRSLEFEHGGSRANGLSWYLAGNVFNEDGWRDDSPSSVRQGLGKVGWLHGKTNLMFTVAGAYNALTGNGLQEQRLLAADYASVYTVPDDTDNHSAFVNLTGQHNAGGRVETSGNIYYRRINTKTFNGDLNDDSLDESVYQPSAADQAALKAAGYTGFPTSGANAMNTPFPSWRCIAQVLENDEPGEKCDGEINRTSTAQSNYGATGQVTLRATGTRRSNQLTAGGAFDGSHVGFTQSTQLGYLNPDRSVTPLNSFEDGGLTGGNIDSVPLDNRVDLDGRIRTLSAYATDTLTLGSMWNLTFSGRFNRTALHDRDGLHPDGGPESLNGDDVFSRFNPAVGLTVNPSKSLNVYASYSEGSRAPTSIELGCANPDQPCKLPNSLAGDPPLNQVVTHTVEGGVRSREGRPVMWSVDVFHAENTNDILFVTSTESGFGYFKNFGETRRQGIEFNASRKVGRVTIGSDYTFLDATYQSEETVDGSANSTNDAALGGDPGLDGTIQIEPGDRIPLIPRHTIKAYADIAVTSHGGIDIDVVGISSSYARGNENNLDQPDGLFYLGSGTAPGYVVADLGAHYQLTPRLTVTLQVNNMLNRQYYTAAQLSATGFTPQGNFIARPFLAEDGDFPLQSSVFEAPGAPRAYFVSVGIKF